MLKNLSKNIYLHIPTRASSKILQRRALEIAHVRYQRRSHTCAEQLDVYA